MAKQIGAYYRGSRKQKGGRRRRRQRGGNIFKKSFQHVKQKWNKKKDALKGRFKKAIKRKVKKTILPAMVGPNMAGLVGHFI